jgi:cob(I)alamin adenosyltransferase
MSRVSIQQFRATLAGRSDQSAVVHAYRALARRPEMATMTFVDWVAWPPAATPTAGA